MKHQRTGVPIQTCGKDVRILATQLFEKDRVLGPGELRLQFVDRLGKEPVKRVVARGDGCQFLAGHADSLLAVGVFVRFPPLVDGRQGFLNRLGPRNDPRQLRKMGGRRRRVSRSCLGFGFSLFALALLFLLVGLPPAKGHGCESPFWGEVAPFPPILEQKEGDFVNHRNLPAKACGR